MTTLIADRCVCRGVCDVSASRWFPWRPSACCPTSCCCFLSWRSTSCWRVTLPGRPPGPPACGALASWWVWVWGSGNFRSPDIINRKNLTQLTLNRRPLSLFDRLMFVLVSDSRFYLELEHLCRAAKPEDAALSGVRWADGWTARNQLIKWLITPYITIVQMFVQVSLSGVTAVFLCVQMLRQVLHMFSCVQMLRQVLYSCVCLLASGICCLVSATGLVQGPLCLHNTNTGPAWGVPLKPTADQWGPHAHTHILCLALTDLDILLTRLFWLLAVMQDTCITGLCGLECVWSPVVWSSGM